MFVQDLLSMVADCQIRQFTVERNDVDAWIHKICMLTHSKIACGLFSRCVHIYVGAVLDSDHVAEFCTVLAVLQIQF